MTDVKKQQHTKRSFPPNSKHIHPHPHLDSPAYDASEEDNDPLTDDAASAVSVHISSSRNRDKTGSVNASSNARNALQTGASRPSQARHALASSLVSSDDGVDSPTYDGDIESSTTAAGPHLDPTYRTTTSSSHHYAASIASTLSPSTPPSTLPHVKSVQRPTPAHPSLPTEPAPAMPIPLHSAKASDLVQVVNPNNPSELIASYPLDPLAATLLAPNTPNTFNPANLTPEDIQAHFREQIDGEGIAVGVGEERTFYKINEPAKGRPGQDLCRWRLRFVPLWTRLTTSTSEISIPKYLCSPCWSFNTNPCVTAPRFIRLFAFFPPPCTIAAVFCIFHLLSTIHPTRSPSPTPTSVTTIHHVSWFFDANAGHSWRLPSRGCQLGFAMCPT
ncbi:hypothetical protein QCA50_008030 [Cerrena zonata]|uniref:Uncharacterized protein n=1 Tax=Cerrena zonata TaxID=2478898 RepID=A0AAW0G7U4_9APHY